MISEIPEAESYKNTESKVDRFTTFHASIFINNYYRILFPAFLLATVFSFLFGDQLLSILLNIEPVGVGGYLQVINNVINERVTTVDLANATQFQNNLVISFALFLPIFAIILADLEIRKKQLNYTQKASNSSKIGAFFFILTCLGLYFLLSLLLQLLASVLFGNSFISDARGSVTSFDNLAINAVNTIAIDPSLKTQMLLLSIAFVLIYIAYEFIFRGIIANEARAVQLPPRTYFVLPAIVQGIALLNSTTIFTIPHIFVYNFLLYFLLGSFSGIIFWRTGRLWASVAYNLLAFFLNVALPFQETVLKSLPEQLGRYNPFDSQTTTPEIFALYLTYIQIAILIAGPVLAILFYQESWKICKEIYLGFRKNYRGFFVVALAFFIVDLIFSFFFSSSSIVAVAFGAILAMVIVGFLIKFLLDLLLPQPNATDLVYTMHRVPINELYPINVQSDIKFLENREPFWYSYKIMALLAIVAYNYILFISGNYRIYSTYSLELLLRYIFFFIILPSLFFAADIFFLSRSIKRGFFFAEKWRRRAYILLLVIFAINIVVWVRDASIISFTWAVVPLFFVFAITIWAKPVEVPVAEFSKGFTGTGRNPTFRWIKHHPADYLGVFDKLHQSKIDQVVVGSYIAQAKYGEIDGNQIVEKLRKSKTVSEKVGTILALGITKETSGEGVLVDQLKEEDFEVKKAAFWALGNVGTRSSLPSMAATLESTPERNLVKIAEKAILKIDPDYPLASLGEELIVAL